jgi:hypothetical protein
MVTSVDQNKSVTWSQPIWKNRHKAVGRQLHDQQRVMSDNKKKKGLKLQGN